MSATPADTARVELTARPAAAFADARLVEIPGARTFVALDAADRLTPQVVALAESLP